MSERASMRRTFSGSSDAALSTLIRELHDAATSTDNLSLLAKLNIVPRICVVGDTSSGKSSLLSALSMVDLPSHHAITTKCPILLSLLSSSSFSSESPTARGATVRIQWDNNSRDHEQEPVFLEEAVKDINELPAAILAAQEFILEQMPPGNNTVSMDCIQVDIYGSDWEYDLMLVDLPGLVQSIAQNESETLVEDIDAVVQSYMQNEQSLVLAVVPANVDFHNSRVLSMARTIDPKGERTIPVITKPDLIDEGAEADVVKLLMGEILDFPLGFHMVKCRGQSSLDNCQSLEESLNEENSYFSQKLPWKDLSDQSLFGIPKLREKLADWQVRRVRARIPSLIRELEIQHDEAYDKLTSMGKLHLTSMEKRRFYQDLSHSYLSNLKASLSGKGRWAKAAGEASAASRLHDACAKFMDSIREGSLATIRNIVEGAQVLISTANGDVRGEVVYVEKDHACCDFVEEKDQPTAEALFDYVGYQSTEVLEENVVWSDGSKVFINRKDSRFDLLKKIPKSRMRTDPSWLIQKLADNRTDDLACFLNVEIFKSIVSDFIDEDWKPHCTSLVNETTDIVLGAVSSSLEKTFAGVERYPKLKTLLRKHSETSIRMQLQDARKQVKSHLQVEKHPYTQDDVLMEDIAAARHESLKRELEVSLRLDQGGGVIDTLAIKSIVDEVFERDRRKSVEEHMAEDMEIVLESYGKVATKRVIDRTPMICWEFFRSVCDNVQDSLWNTTDGEMEEAMQERSDFEREYKALTKQVEETHGALHRLRSVL